MSGVHEPEGTTSEVGAKTHILRSVAVIAPIVMFIGALGWVTTARAGNTLPVVAGPQPTEIPADQVLGEVALAEPSPQAVSEIPPESTPLPPPPVLIDASVVTAGRPVEVLLDAPAGLQLTRPPSRGLAQVELSGRATYIPNANFVGTDSFTVDSCNAAGCGQATVTVDVLPAAVSAYVNAPVERIVDTRSGELLLPGSTVEAVVKNAADYEAVALSVTLMAAQTAGGVEVDAGTGPIAALAVSGAGAMTTNLVIVPASSDSPIAVTTTAGGHLVVDVVGYFESRTESTYGRFVQVDPVRVAHLTTAVDGREGTVNVRQIPDVPDGEVGAVLALVTADVGRDGGRVLLGPGVAEYDQMLMWGAPTGPNLQRRGVVLVAPDAEGNFSFGYEGGSEIDVDVLGYFTSDAAPSDRTGLFVPSEQTQVIRADFAAGEHIVGTLPGYAAAAFVTLTAAPGVTEADDPRELSIASGRTIGTALSVAAAPDGTGQGVVVRSTTNLEAQLQVLGIFLSDSTS